MGAWTAPSQKMEKRVYRSKRSQIVVLAFLLLFCLGVVGAALLTGGGIAHERDAGQKYGRLTCALMFGAILIGTVRWNLKHLASFEVDETGFYWRGLIKTIRYEWGDLVSYRRGVDANQGYTFLFNRKREVVFQFVRLENGDELKRWVDVYVVPYIGNWLHKPEPERGEIVSVMSERYAYLWLTIVLGPVLIAGTWFKVAEDGHNWTVFVLFAVAGGFVLLNIVKTMVHKVVLTEDTLRIQNLFQSWSLPLEDVWEVHIASVATYQSVFEKITLLTMEKVYQLNSGESEYIRLRNTLIERTPMATVIDERPPDQQTYLPRVDIYFVGDGSGKPFHE